MSQGGVLLLMLALSAQSQHDVKVEQAHEQAERFCLTQALYYEARGEGERGQLAVADVILRRKSSKNHPDTICEVVYQPYQFSFVSDGSTLKEIDVDSWNKADELSGRILRGEVKTSVTGRALFYHAKSVQPEWADEMIKTTEIGNHIFYRRAPKQRSS